MKLQKIKEKLAKLLCELSVVKTDNGVLSYDGDELAPEMSVFIENENGERVAPQDGEYKTEDNKVITIKDGKVATIVEIEVEEELEDVKEEEKEEVVVEETMEEVEEVVEEEVEETMEEETDSIEKMREEINELYKIVDKILSTIGEDRAEVDARIEKIEKMSMANPADEVFETNASSKSNILNEKMSKRIAEMNRDWRKM